MFAALAVLGLGFFEADQWDKWDARLGWRTESSVVLKSAATKQSYLRGTGLCLWEHAWQGIAQENGFGICVTEPSGREIATLLTLLGITVSNSNFGAGASGKLPLLSLRGA